MVLVLDITPITTATNAVGLDLVNAGSALNTRMITVLSVTLR
jgi:hypothetical protein|tara:strand:- start:1281 stop:1406 length:126 start_codon:yes stop_codon:yes gene_type:complete